MFLFNIVSSFKVSNIIGDDHIPNKKKGKVKCTLVQALR